jgi:hypothetical protein
MSLAVDAVYEKVEEHLLVNPATGVAGSNVREPRREL